MLFNANGDTWTNRKPTPLHCQLTMSCLPPLACSPSLPIGAGHLACKKCKIAQFWGQILEEENVTFCLYIEADFSAPN